eukprot:CFRG7258T1
MKFTILFITLCFLMSLLGVYGGPTPINTKTARYASVKVDYDGDKDWNVRGRPTAQINDPVLAAGTNVIAGPETWVVGV